MRFAPTFTETIRFNAWKRIKCTLCFQAAYSASGPNLHLFWMFILLSSFFLILSTFLERYSVVFR